MHFQLVAIIKVLHNLVCRASQRRRPHQSPVSRLLDQQNRFLDSSLDEGRPRGSGYTNPVFQQSSNSSINQSGLYYTDFLEENERFHQSPHVLVRISLECTLTLRVAAHLRQFSSAARQATALHIYLMYS